MAARRGGGYRPPLTVSREAMLRDGSDAAFRQFLQDFLTVGACMEVVRAHLGRRSGLTGPQYSVLMAVAHLQGDHGVSVTRLARHLHVSGAFVTTESAKLIARGLLLKRRNPADGRSVLLSLAPRGRLLLGRLGPEIRGINDLFFGSLSAGAFDILRRRMVGLVASARVALSRLAATSGDVQQVVTAARGAPRR